jgi:hypothetical protein
MRSRVLPQATVALLIATAVFAQAPGGMKGEEAFPQGGLWLEETYAKVKEETRVEARALATPTLAREAATALKGLVPSNLTLGAGVATRVMATQSSRLFGEATATGPEARSGEKWFVEYPVAYEGVPLSKRSSVFAIVGADGRMLYVRRRNLPENVDATTPTVTSADAVAAAMKHAAETGAASLKATAPALEIHVDADGVGHLAWTFDLQSDSRTDPQGRKYWIGATGEAHVLSWESTVYHTHFGTVTGTLWSTTPLKPTASQPLAALDVTRSTGGTAVTGADGRYSFPAGAGTATVTAALEGPFFVVQNQAGAGIKRSQSGTPTSAIDLNLGATGEFETAQVSAFAWANVAFDFARSILEPLPTQPYAALPTLVNINSTCNAYWDGSSINFFRAGSGCPNTAYSDVVLHEYGHGIDQWRGGILDGGYSEGFGDAVALLVTRQPCLGRDFQGAGTCLRPATDVNMWPPAPGEEVHAQGKRYAQFTWQLVQELQKTYSQDESYRLAARLTLAAAAGNPSSIPDAVRLCFLADDDDGDLTNGSPHFKELAAAADSRNIPRPADPGSTAGVLQIDVVTDTAVCASGAVQCTVAGTGHTAQAASSANHNPLRMFVLVQAGGVGVPSLTLSNFAFANPFVPAGGGSATICPTASCGSSNFGGSAGLYTIFLDRLPAGNWKAGAYGASLTVTFTKDGTTYHGIGLVTFTIP